MPASVRAAAVLFAALMGACGSGTAPLVDVTVPGDTADDQGPYEIVAVITDDGEIASARVEWFLEGAAGPAPAELKQDSLGNRWVAQLPGAPVGSVIRFTVRVEDDEGHVVVVQAKGTDGDVPFSFRVLGPGSG